MDHSEYERIKEGALLHNVMPQLIDEVERMQKAALNSAYALIGRNELTAEKALNTLYELYSANRLLQSFRSRVKMGITLGETNKTDLERGLPDG